MKVLEGSSFSTRNHPVDFRVCLCPDLNVEILSFLITPQDGSFVHTVLCSL